MKLSRSNVLTAELALLAAAAYLGRESASSGIPLASLVVFLTLLSTVIGLRLSVSKHETQPCPAMPRPQPISDRDVKLFDSVVEALPYEPTIRTLKETDFGNDYFEAAVAPLHAFVATWDSLDKEFNDAVLEHRRKALYQSAKELSEKFMLETIPHDGNESLRTVYPVRARGFGPRPPHIIESARVLNEGSRSFVSVYEDFVRFGRKRIESHRP